MNIFFEYLKFHIKTLLLITVFTLIFIIVFVLYSIPLNVVLYCFLLFISFLIIFTIVDFYHFYIRHKNLVKIKKNISISISDLPIPKTLPEKDYNNIICELFSYKTKLISEYDTEKIRMIDYYTAWVHQIKTPISAMHLLLQSETDFNINDIDAELFKIEQYVEMVMNYARLDSSYTDFVVKNTNIDNVIKQALRKYAKIFIGKKICLKYSETKLYKITDEKWLLFVIEQIISNALKYTQKGYIQICLNDSDSICIADTGIGISDEDIPRVFDKGFTGFNGRKDKKSTGIGLYLCKRILTNLGHRIEIESKLGYGTKVIIYFQNSKLNFE